MPTVKPFGIRRFPDAGAFISTIRFRSAQSTPRLEVMVLGPNNELLSQSARSPMRSAWREQIGSQCPYSVDKVSVKQIKMSHGANKFDERCNLRVRLSKCVLCIT